MTAMIIDASGVRPAVDALEDAVAGRRHTARTSVRSLSYLKPSESLTEVVAGLIMALTFTLGASVLSGGGADGVRAALVGAIGCNVAWGIIDGVLYMMASTFERNRQLRFRRAIASAADKAAALAAIRGELDPYLASVTPNFWSSCVNSISAITTPFSMPP